MLALQKALPMQAYSTHAWVKFLPQDFHQRRAAAAAAAAAATPASTSADAVTPTPQLPGQALCDRVCSDLSQASTSVSGSSSTGARDDKHSVCSFGVDAGAPHVLGRVRELSQDADGCREVQSALEDAADRQARLAVAAELRGFVWEAVGCPQANYVVQKCIMTMLPEDFQFVLDELFAGEGGPAAAAMHKYGCRIVKRLLEYGCEEQVDALAEELLADTLAMSTHPYGTFVVQHMLLHAGERHRNILFGELQAHAQTLCRNAFGCAAVHAALSHGGHTQAVALCRTILAEPGLLSAMGCLRYGQPAVVEAVALLQGEEEEDVARRDLMRHIQELRACRYGRQVISALNLSVQAGNHPARGKRATR